jgi:hypothetical protein
VLDPARAVASLASKGRRPVAISYRTTPAAQMSLRPSTGSPRNCSGAMQGSVPAITCVSVKTLRGCYRAEGLQQLGKTKVEYLRLTFWGHLDVPGLQVTVHYTALVGFLRGRGNL